MDNTIAGQVKNKIPERTINGENVKEVLRKFSGQFDAETISKLKNGNTNLVYFAYRARLDEVIGETNYDFMTGDLEHRNVQGKDILMCSGTLIIKDDRGLAVKTIKAFGGTPILSNGNAGLISIGSDMEYVMRSAFTNCFKLLSVNAAKQFEELGQSSMPQGNVSYQDGYNGTDFRSMNGSELQRVPFHEQQNQVSSNNQMNSTNRNIQNSGSQGTAGNSIPGFGKAFPMPEKEKPPVNDKMKQIYHVRLVQALTSLAGGGYKAKVYVEEFSKEMPFRIFKEGIDSIQECGLDASVFLSGLSIGAEFSFLGFLNDYKGAAQLVMEAVARE